MNSDTAERGVDDPSTGHTVLTEAVTELAAPACVVDGNGVIVATNPAWDGIGEVTDTAASQIGVGADYLAVCRRSADAGDSTAAGALRVLEDVLSGREPQGTFDYPCPDATSLRWYRMTVVPSHDRSLALVVHQDVTANRGLHPTSPERRSSFVDRTIHELAAPITIMLGLIDTIRDHGPGLTAQEIEDYLDRASSNAHRSAALIRGLRELEAHGREQPRPVAVDLAEATATAAEAAGIAVEITIADDGAYVRADAGHLQRVLINLLTNGEKYGEPPYEVSATRHKRRVVVTVRDHGPGVPDDVRPHLFEHYRRSSQHIESGVSGTGLGLSIVRDLVELNGGTIRLDPSTEGATFVIDLPAAEAPSTAGINGGSDDRARSRADR